MANGNKNFLLLLFMIIAIIVIVCILYKRGDISSSCDYYRGSMPHY